MTPEQLQAITEYAKINGRTWKRQLSADWFRAYYPSVDERFRCYLQQLRNDPDFNLKSFRLD